MDVDARSRACGGWKMVSEPHGTGVIVGSVVVSFVPGFWEVALGSSGSSGRALNHRVISPVPRRNLEEKMSSPSC